MKTHSLLIVLSFLVACIATNLSKAAELDLTLDERAWLKEHSVIRIGVDTEYAPFEYVDEEGNYQGIAPQYLKLIGKRLGIEFTVVSGLTWKQVVEGAKNRIVDMVPVMQDTKERREFLNFTRPYLKYPTVIFTRNDFPSLNGLEDLAGKNLAIPEGYSEIKEIGERYPAIKIVQVKNLLEGLKAVATRSADATQGNLAVLSYLIQENNITNLKVAASPDTEGGENAMGVRKDWPEFVAILEKAIKSITRKERQRILSNWLPAAVVKLDAPPVDLTPQQRRWLKNHNEFSLGVDSSFAPFEFFDDQGTYSGIGSGYVELIGSRLGITLTPKSSLSWIDVINKAKSGDVDILPTVVRTPAREKYLNFTKPYISFPMVITTRKDAPFVDSLAGLAGNKVGVVKGHVSQELIEANHKNIIIVTVKNLSQGLRQLTGGKLDAFVDNLLAITHEIDRSNLDDLKIASPTKYKLELSMGVRKDFPELVPILNKALESITERERAAIINSWTAIQVQFGMDMKTILTWAVPIGSTAVIIILVIVVWNRKMGREIDQRKKAQAELTIAHDKLGDAMMHIEDSINYASRIQRSVLPDETLFTALFEDYFILWEPRDVVGGDIYWANTWGDGVIMILGDCTGHGVPGAFMTLITTGAMDRALIDTEAGEVGVFLQRIHQMVQVTLGQHGDEGESDDGMELGVCYFKQNAKTMTFASARFDLFQVEDGDVTIVKPTKSGIGYRGIPFDQEFAEHRVELSAGKCFYMTSDGLVDQVGGERGRMFGKNRFKKLLLSVQDKSMSEQKEALFQALVDYQGDENRRDDVAVIGFKL